MSKVLDYLISRIRQHEHARQWVWTPEIDDEDRFADLDEIESIVDRIAPTLSDPTAVYKLIEAGRYGGWSDALTPALAALKATERRIPPAKRLGPWSKAQAVQRLGLRTNEKRAVETIGKMIDDGLIRYEAVSRQAGWYHADDFPPLKS